MSPLRRGMKQIPSVPWEERIGSCWHCKQDAQRAYERSDRGSLSDAQMSFGTVLSRWAMLGRGGEGSGEDRAWT